jgi:hypothetical protein
MMLHTCLYMYTLTEKLGGDKMTFDIILYIAIEMAEAMFNINDKRKGSLNVEAVYERVLRDFFQDERPEKSLINNQKVPKIGNQGNTD